MKHYFIYIATLLMVITACDAIDQVESTFLHEKESIEGVRIPHSINPLSQEEAVMVARQFASMNGVRTKTNDSKNIGSVYAIDGKPGTPAMYAVNYGENDGFVIINTSKKYFPILAYSETGHYAQDRNASGLDVWLDEQRVLIEAAETLPLDSLKEVTKSWRNYEKNTFSSITTKSGDDTLSFRDAAIAEWELDGFECMDLATSSMYLPPTVYNQWCGLAAEQSNPNYNYMQTAVVLYYGTENTSQVGPFLSTTWGQDAPYNELLPPIGALQPRAGAAIVAMAQIMRYYEWPTGYNWSSMSNNTATYSTKLLYYNLGSDAQTTYGINGSSTNINNLKNAITGNQYSYHYNASVVSHSYATTKSNINGGKPVIMRGNQNTSTHYWVCDGLKTHTSTIHLVLMVYTPDDHYLQAENGGYYSDSSTSEYLHMNWGEDGGANGWFSGDSVAFSGYVWTSWVQFNYSSDRKDIVNIIPNN